MLRFILFGSWRSKVSEGVGILFLWLGIDTVLVVLACIVHYKKGLAASAKASSAAGAAASRIPETSSPVENPAASTTNVTVEGDLPSTASTPAH